jgi:hypothetical protein
MNDRLMSNMSSPCPMPGAAAIPGSEPVEASLDASELPEPMSVRQTGRSFALRLACLADAAARRGTCIRYVDHHRPESAFDRLRSNRLHAEELSRMAQAIDMMVSVAHDANSVTVVAMPLPRPNTEGLQPCPRPAR